MSKKKRPNPYYPYANESQYRMANALKQIQLAYGVEEDENIKKEIEELFDPLTGVQNSMEDKVEETQNETVAK